MYGMDARRLPVQTTSALKPYVSVHTCGALAQYHHDAITKEARVPVNTTREHACMLPETSIPLS